jgi:hypothetical protein
VRIVCGIKLGDDWIRAGFIKNQRNLLRIPADFGSAEQWEKHFEKIGPGGVRFFPRISMYVSAGVKVR